MKYWKPLFSLMIFLPSLAACGSSSDKAPSAANAGPSQQSTAVNKKKDATAVTTEPSEPVEPPLPPPTPEEIFRGLLFKQNGSCDGNDRTFSFAASARIGQIRGEDTPQEAFLWWGADVAILENGSYQAAVGYSINDTEQGEWKITKGSWAIQENTLVLSGLGKVLLTKVGGEGDTEIQFGANVPLSLRDQTASLFVLETKGARFDFVRKCP